MQPGKRKHGILPLLDPKNNEPHTAHTVQGPPYGRFLPQNSNIDNRIIILMTVSVYPLAFPRRGMYLSSSNLALFQTMTTLSISCPKCLGFYSQGLQDKLFPFLGNGEKLTLDDGILLTIIASEGSYWASRTKEPQGIKHILDVKNDEIVDRHYFEGFDCYFEEFQAIVLDLSEWLALARWSSELSELRLNDYSRATRDLTPGQLAAPWEVL